MVGVLERIKTVLGHRSMPWTAALLAVALCAISLGAGLQTEDYVQRDAVLGAHGKPARCLDLFDFVRPSPAESHDAKSLGVVPWYASEGLAISFWRPLTSLSHCVDYRSFPDSPALMHAENLLWFALAIAAVGALYRRLLVVPWVAGLATLLYAIDDAHGPAVGWIASRNAMMTTLFSALALLAYDRARRARSRAFAALSIGCFALALASGEAAVCALAYMGAYALVLDDAAPRARALSLAPHALLFVAWRALYASLGHGSLGSSLYVDPLRAWDGFVAAVAQRVPVLLASQLGGPTADRLQLMPQERTAAIVLGSIAALSLVALLLVPLLRASRTARFFGLGMLLAAVPTAAAPPSDRLLFPIGIGAMALVAEQMALACSSASRAGLSPPWRWGSGLLAAGFAVVHGLVAPVRLPGRSNEVRTMGERIARASETMFAGAKALDEVVVLRGPEMFGCTFAVALAYRLGVTDKSVARCLSAGPSETTIRRLDDYTISLAPEGGFLDPPLNRLQWDEGSPMEKGDVVRLAWLTITIDEVTDQGEPRVVSFRFERKLDDPGLRWVVWREGRYEPIALPAPGEPLVLAAQEDG